MRLLRLRFLQSIRGQLLASFILLALLPALAIGGGSLWSGYVNGRQQAFERLESASSLKQIEMERWLEEALRETNAALTEEYAYDRILTVLALAAENRYFRFYNGAVRSRFQILVSQSSSLEALSLLDRQGRVAISTDLALEGSDLSSLPCFQRTLTQPAFELSLASESGQAALYVGVPVFDTTGNPVGVMMARARAGRAAEILQENTGLGARGRAYLVDSSYRQITAEDIRTAVQGQAVATHQVHSDGIQALLDQKTLLTGIFEGEDGKQALGVYRWLPSLELGLVVEQDLSDALSIALASLTVTFWVSLVALALGVLAALWLARRLALPVTRLAEAARRISRGDLSVEVKVERSGEIGDLAHAFHSMTAQLSDLINRLEQRVAERTAELEQANRELQHRALQVETSFQVGRQITSILQITPLLQRIVDLIRQSFSYEQVAIYLLDANKACLEMQACSPYEGSPHRTITLNENSLNGSCAVSRRAQVVNDVRLEPRFLPEEGRQVLSEMVIPLMVGEELIGTLDMESAHLDAFTDRDVLAIQNLADQIAIAIQNARLYERTRELAVLEERNRLSRELHDSVIQSLYSLNLLAGGWQRLLEAEQPLEMQQYLQRVRQISEQALREMRLLVHQLRPPVLEEVGLLDALHQRLDAVEKRAGINARLVVDGVLEVPPALEEPFYWIAQEALNNALKHASPASVTVRLQLQSACMLLEVSDDGCGFDVQQAALGGGMGLRIMRERAAAVGADLTIHSAPGQGTRVRLSAEVPDAHLKH